MLKNLNEKESNFFLSSVSVYEFDKLYGDELLDSEQLDVRLTDFKFYFDKESKSWCVKHTLEVLSQDGFKKVPFCFTTEVDNESQKISKRFFRDENENIISYQFVRNELKREQVGALKTTILPPIPLPPVPSPPFDGNTSTFVSGFAANTTSVIKAITSVPKPPGGELIVQPEHNLKVIENNQSNVFKDKVLQLAIKFCKTHLSHTTYSQLTFDDFTINFESSETFDSSQVVSSLNGKIFLLSKEHGKRLNLFLKFSFDFNEGKHFGHEIVFSLHFSPLKDESLKKYYYDESRTRYKKFGSHQFYSNYHDLTEEIIFALETYESVISYELDIKNLILGDTEKIAVTERETQMLAAERLKAKEAKDKENQALTVKENETVNSLKKLEAKRHMKLCDHFEEFYSGEGNFPIEQIVPELAKDINANFLTGFKVTNLHKAKGRAVYEGNGKRYIYVTFPVARVDYTKAIRNEYITYKYMCDEFGYMCYHGPDSNQTEEVFHHKGKPGKDIEKHLSINFIRRDSEFVKVQKMSF